MPFNKHQDNVRRHPYAGGRNFVRPHVGRGRGCGQSQGLRNATPGYGRITNNYRQFDDYYQLALQQLPLTAVTLYPQPLYAELLSAAVNNAIRLSVNDNYLQYQDQVVIQSQSESHVKEVYPNQAHRGTKRKNTMEHGERGNMTYVADQTLFGDRHESMYEVNAINQGVDYGLLKAKGHASFINREAATQAIEGMFQRGEPITLSWNPGISTAPPNTAPRMPSHTAKRQRIVSARESLALERADPDIYFKLRDANTRLKAAANPTICGNCHDRGHTEIPTLSSLDSRGVYSTARDFTSLATFKMPSYFGQHRLFTEKLGGVDCRTSSWENTKVYYGGDMSAGNYQRPQANHGQRR
ncbi:hypothetical protein FACUT_689 [Fusarium acutatum]|uniref:Uncharacterized protein n=1 Tax=Fusarium acutatum TaxID=78861 RepID=A0A8H4P0P2_9HYPO|nr:hypothetical protein FACUT_689 [Fusarium acutatum]